MNFPTILCQSGTKKIVLSFKIILTILCICWSNILQASNYYFSNLNGNDQNTFAEAQNSNTPWKSIDKLNAIFIYLNAGDSILLKRNEVFYGTITITKSGGPFAPIYFGAYGKGHYPVISGLVKLNTWKSDGNGIYESFCNYIGNALILNDCQQPMGRFPNKGYLSYSSHEGNNSITDNKLNNVLNWTGAEVVIRKTRWVIDKSKIIGQSDGKLNYAPGNKTLPTNGFGYFIQNSVKTLDQFGEWYFDASRSKMMVYFGDKNPDVYLAQYSGLNSLVKISKHSFITFENIAFVGAGADAIDIRNSSNIILKNCKIDNSGSNAILVAYSPFTTLKNLTINHSLNEAIDCDAGCTYAVIANNEIRNTGLIPGLGKSGTGTYEAITAFGDHTQIEKNYIDSTGYDGIYFGGNFSVAKNNFIDYFCLVKDDGAGIYIADWSLTFNKQVLGNIILHGIGAGEGSNNPSYLQAEGIYIDDNSESLTITGNTVSLCANSGIKIHNAKNIRINSNTVYNNGVQLKLEQDSFVSKTNLIRDNQITNNIFFARTDHQANAGYSSHLDDISSFGNIDSNIYCRPNDMIEIKTEVKRNGKQFSKSYDLADWIPVYHQDKISTKTLRKIKKDEDLDNLILFECNPADIEKVVILQRPYLDVHNHVYKDKIIISPYSSVLLVASETPNDQHTSTQLLNKY